MLKQITAKPFTFTQHLLVLGPNPPKKWTSDLFKTDTYLSSLTAATGILPDVKISSSFSEPANDPSALIHVSDHIPDNTTRDILVYPEMIHLKAVPVDAFDIVTRYLVECRLGVFHKTPLGLKEIEARQMDLKRERHLLVCAHAAVDSRCGVRGAALQRELEARFEKYKHQHKYRILPTSHLGGHDFAANLISYPKGDWYGNLAQTPESAVLDAARVIEACETDTVLLWDNWRGRVGLEDSKLVAKMAELKKDLQDLPSAASSGCCGGSGSKTGASSSASTSATPPETIKVTYVLQNGQRIEVDAELTEFTPADPSKPYFPTETNQESLPSSASSTNTDELPEKKDDEVDFTFVLGSGATEERRLVRSKFGKSLMEIARDFKIPTIDGVCGGNMECATCHVIVDKPHFDALPKASEGEEDMLEYAIGRKDCSRLACQLKTCKEMEGMELRVHTPPGSEVFI